jgi:DNA repair exonuclease SbcCD ATPase subunit
MCLRLKTEGIADDREAVDTAPIPWRPLGQVFVEKGLITEEELEEALAEQQATGKRLGEILVARGLVSGPDLTAALMDQLGVEVQRDQGFGSGLWSEIQRRHARARRLQTAGTASAPPPTEAGDGAPEEGELVDQRPPRAPGERPSLVVLEGMLDELEEPSRGGAQAEAPSGEATPGPDTQAATHLAALEARLGEGQAEAATAQAELERLREEAAALAAERAEERSAREAAQAEAARLREEAEGEAAGLRASLAATAEELQQAQAQLAELEETLASREEELRAAQAQGERLAAELEARAQAEAAAQAALERLREEAAQLRTETEGLRAEARAARAAATEAQASLSREEAARAEERARLQAAEERLGLLEGQLAASEARAVEERAAHAETRRVLARALDELSGRPALGPSAGIGSSSAPLFRAGHLLFAPSPKGYEIAHRDGSPPALGSEVELAGQVLLVVKVGRSPIPFDPRPCAYLWPRR